MRRFLVCFLIAASLSACHPQDPRRTGLYASARDVLPADATRLAACLTRALRGPVRQHAAPDGSWLLLSDGAPDVATWELRLTRVDALRTELEVDASLNAPGLGTALAHAAAACAGR
jgi:hypothetical protein